MSDSYEKLKKAFIESVRENSSNLEEALFFLSERDKDVLFSNDVSLLRDRIRKDPKFNVNVFYSRKFKQTPLHAVTNPEKIELLLSQGANPNIQDYSGKTPLHIHASSRSDESGEICEMLLYAGADPTIKDNDGETALDYATKANNKETVDMLNYWINKNFSKKVEEEAKSYVAVILEGLEKSSIEKEISNEILSLDSVQSELNNLLNKAYEEKDEKIISVLNKLKEEEFNEEINPFLQGTLYALALSVLLYIGAGWDKSRLQAEFIKQDAYEHIEDYIRDQGRIHVTAVAYRNLIEEVLLKSFKNWLSKQSNGKEAMEKAAKKIRAIL